MRLVLSVLRRLVAGRVSLGIELDLRNLMYAHLQGLELGFFAGQQTGQLMSRATVDLQAVRFFLGYGLVFIVQSALTILLGAAAMFLLQPGLAALALIPVPFVVVISARYGRQSRPALQEVQQRIAELTADVEENVSGVRVVKAFAAEERQLDRFRGTVLRVFDQSMIATRMRAFYNPFIGFLPNIGLAVILLVGGRQVISGTLSLGDFTAFYAYLLMLIAPMRQLGVVLGLAQRATASGARVFELLDREPRIVSPPGAPPLPEGRGRVELRGVRFAYEGASAPALRDIDLVVEAGTTVALVGGTGSGKSTLVRLLGRLYDVTEGVGADRRRRRTRASTSCRCAREIAVVDDDPFLFSASVRENIGYGRPDATDAEIELAAERAQAAGFIAELPNGYDTRVGERGLTLSGGQRQRVAIARALLADPRILVLDDATSSVDASTEQAIKTALREVMAGRTTFVIAHRLSTIALADDIVVLEGGTRGRSRHARPAARPQRAVRGDRGQGPAGPGVPHPQATRGGAGPVTSRRDEIVRRWRATSGRGRKLRGLLVLLRPYRARTVLMFASLIIGTAAALAPPPLAKLAIDDGITPGDTRTLTLVVIAFLFSALVYWGATWVQTYLVGWVGQRVLQDLRIQLFAHLQTLSVGFYSRRQAGVIISRLTNDVQALDQLVSDGVVTLFGSTLTLVGTAVILLLLDVKLALLTFLVFPILALASLGVPRRVGQRVPAHAREGRADHRVPAGEPVGRPRRALVRAGTAAPRALQRAQRGQLRREHEDRQPERGVLPGRRDAVRASRPRGS